MGTVTKRARGRRSAASLDAGSDEDMSQPLIVSVPHSLGKDEPVRRLKSGLGAAQSRFGQFFSVQEETWVGDRLRFRVAALGQTATGTVNVAEDHGRLEVTLPWRRAQIAQWIQRVVTARGTIMLENR